MREIRFRAWDLDSNKMVYDVCACYGITPKDHVLMQFTGLHDKNGKKIYEGDICTQEFTGKVIGTVSIDTTRGVLVGIHCIWPHNVEVIGNIYEHPHLLEQSDE